MTDRPVSTADIARARAAEDRTPAAVHDRDVRTPAPHPHEHGHAAESHVPLFADEEGRGLRSRWDAIQTGFVDEPRAAVEQADALVAQIMTRLAQVFADERTTLEQQWSRGDNVSTEDLRIALKRYRSFFERLLSL